MVRSLTNRGKNKRKVKLVEDKLIQLTFGDHSDSEDDEDFELNEDDLDSDDSNFGEQKDQESANDDDSDDNDADEVKKNENEEEEEEQDEEDEKEEIEESTKSLDHKESAEDTDTEIENEVSFVKVFRICGICLESESSETDEILECDNCGITVHEGCYGDIDTPDYADESDSDAPTEPWFCEPCKAGLVEPPICQLCPNIGGIYKLTDTKKWVHLICALYTPYVGFRDIAKLQTVVLEDIRGPMWGGRECMFCLDDNFARTGVCIGCDAGLCKSAFHVTCGQRNGFLSDIPDKQDQHEHSGDLLYAHCKLHSVKDEILQRKRSWLAFHSHVEKFKPNEDPDEHQRIEESLSRAKKEFNEFKRNIIQHEQSKKEIARFFSSCPEACKMLAKKAEILGLMKHPGYNVSAAVTKGKITKTDPNLSADFVNYFFKREMESKDIMKTLKTSEPHLTKLRKEQRVLTKKSEEFHEKLEKVLQDKDTLHKACEKLHKTLSSLSNKTVKLPNILKPKKLNENKGKLAETSKLLNTVVNKCATCKKTDDQHLLAECDTCKLFYHLACLDPPLTRMPKKSSMYLWQCTECDSSDESESEIETTEESTNGIRRNKRRSVKEPVKFIPEDSPDSNLKRKSVGISLNDKIPKKKKKTKPKVKKDKQEKSKERKPKPKVEKPPPEQLSDCCICNEPGNKHSLVKCDECLKCYHFKTCLDPPYSKTPKGRYWGWICEDCDETDEEYEEEEEEAEEEVNDDDGEKKSEKESQDVILIDDD